MATMPVDLLSSLRVRLDFPKNVLEEYERQAEEDFGVPIEELLASRLSECVGYTATKPLYVTDEQRREIEQLLRRNITDTSQLLAELRKSATLRVDKVTVPLNPEMLRRLSSRHLDKSKTFAQYLNRVVTMALEQYVGLR